MKITLSTYGTLGEILPHIALGQRLQQRGHRVRLALPPSLIGYGEGSGLDLAPCRPDMSPSFARIHAANFASPQPDLPAQAQLSSRERFQDLAGICAGSDLLIASWFPAVSALLRETLGIPWIEALAVGGTLWHPSHEQDRLTLESGNARASGDSYLGTMYEEWRQIRIWRGLRRLDSLTGYFRPDLSLAGVSPSLFPPPGLPTTPEPHFTGFWFKQQAEWLPDRELDAFLERRPIVLSFSSLPLCDRAGVLDLHVRGASRVGRPLLVLSGWAGWTSHDLQPDVPRSEVLFRPFLPFRRVCEQTACAIIHGGIGSLHDAAFAGCPVLVEPYGGDQFLNARAVPRMGIGAVADRRFLAVDGLVRLLNERVLTPETRARAEAVRRRIRKEAGADMACDLIESFAEKSLLRMRRTM